MRWKGTLAVVVTAAVAGLGIGAAVRAPERDAARRPQIAAPRSKASAADPSPTRGCPSPAAPPIEMSKDRGPADLPVEVRPPENVQSPIDVKSPIDVRARMAALDMSDLAETELEFMARVAADPAFAGALYDAFRAEEDPMKMSFLQNVLASSPAHRNSPAWQDRFLSVAEGDASRERRMTALLFLQQADDVAAAKDRLYALAEAEERGDLRVNALISLAGLPDRRAQDPRLAATAGRIADTAKDPELRGVALRVERNPDHAARFLADPERDVRLQAAQVVDAVPTLERALAVETDPEARELLRNRIEALKKS